MVLFIILAFFIIIPLQLSFDFFYDDTFENYAESIHLSHSLSKLLIILPDVLLIIDSTLKMITGYYENGLIVMNKKKILKKYITHTLIFDILSYLPIFLQVGLKDLIVSLHLEVILRVFQFLMYAKAKRIHTIIDTFEEISSLKGKRDHIISLIRLAFWIFFICHINACIWHGIAYFTDNNVTWLDMSELRDSNDFERYIHSLYWAVSVMVTMGLVNISPQNPLEICTAILIYLISAFYYGYSLNTIKEIFDDMSRKHKEYKFFINFL